MVGAARRLRRGARICQQRLSVADRDVGQIVLKRCSSGMARGRAESSQTCETTGRAAPTHEGDGELNARLGGRGPPRAPGV